MPSLEKLSNRVHLILLFFDRVFNVSHSIFSSPSSLDSAHGEQKLVTIIIKKLPSRPSGKSCTAIVTFLLFLK